MIRQSISPMSLNRITSDHKQMGSQYRHSSNERIPNRDSEERVIDYKIFFSTCIKSKIAIYKAPFNDENFIIDHFWRCKFPTTIVPGLRSPSPELLLMD